MYDQIHISLNENQKRDCRSGQEVYFKMNNHSSLTPDERLLLACQTGQFLMAIGQLLAKQSVVNTHISTHTGQSLVNLGRKLVSASKCADNS
jgi:hypothetical protein